MQKLLRLSLPIALSYLLLMTMGLVDLAFVRFVGTSATGAVGIATAFFSWSMTVGLGLLAGLDYFVSTSFGAKDLESGQKYLGQGVWLSLILGVPLNGLLIFASSRLALFGIHPDVVPEAARFLWYLSFGIVPVFLFQAGRNYLQAVNRPGPAFWVIVLANLLNIFLDYAFIFGKAGLPALGSDGCAIASTLGRFFMAIGLAGVLFWPGQNQVRFAALKWNSIAFSKLVKIGFPASLQMMLEVGVFGLSTVLAGGLDPESLAAHQIVLNVASSTFMVPLGIGAATAVLVGQALGRNDVGDARKMGSLGLWTSAGFMVISGALLLAFPSYAISGFTADLNVLGIATGIIFIAALFQLVDGIQAALTGALRGAGDTRSPVYANLVGHWFVGIPLSFGLCYGWGIGIKGIWIGLAVGLLVVAVWLWIVWSQALQRPDGKRAIGSH
jgi:multidrug resistance protein, MATE family